MPLLLFVPENCSSLGSSSVSSFKFPALAFLKYSYKFCSGAVLFLLLSIELMILQNSFGLEF